jgi:hypothetical protein
MLHIVKERREIPQSWKANKEKASPEPGNRQMRGSIIPMRIEV